MRWLGLARKIRKPFAFLCASNCLSDICVAAWLPWQQLQDGEERAGHHTKESRSGGDLLHHLGRHLRSETQIQEVQEILPNSRKATIGEVYNGPLVYTCCIMLHSSPCVSQKSVYSLFADSGSEDMKKRLEFLSWYTTNGESKEELLIFHVSMLVGQVEENSLE